MLMSLHYPKIVIYKHSLNVFEKEWLPEYLEKLPTSMEVTEDNKIFTVSSFDNGASYRMLVQISQICDIEIM